MHNGVVRVSSPQAHTNREAVCHLTGLLEKAALAHPCTALHQDHRSDTREKLVEMLTQERQLGITTSQGVARCTLPRSHSHEPIVGTDR